MKIILNKDKHRLLSHRFFLLLLLQSSHQFHKGVAGFIICLLYTSDAADEL